MNSVVVLALLVSAVVCVDISGRVRVPVSDSCDGVIRLRGEQGERVSVPLSNGAFVFRDVPVGSYVLTVQFVKFAFGDVKLDVLESKESDKALLVKARSLDEPDKLLSLPLDLAPSNLYVYYQEAPTFRVTSILFHPMILMMLVMGGMSFVLPKMVDKNAMNMKELSASADDSSEVDSAASEPVEEAPSILLPRLTVGQQVLLNKPPATKK
jgi:hypothetical protein